MTVVNDVVDIVPIVGSCNANVDIIKFERACSRNQQTYLRWLLLLSPNAY